MLALACGSTLAASHIGFLMPSGARQDSRVEIIVGGQGFWGSHGVHISGGGVTVEKVRYIRSLPNISGSQRRYYNQILRQFHDGKPITVKKPESTEGWRTHSFHERLTELTPCERDITYQAWFVPKNSLQASPAIAGRVIVDLKIDKNAKPGVREFRLVDRNGTLSNPLKFFIGDVPEVREDYFPFPPAVRSIPEIPIPSAVNGQIMPGETDRYTFKAVKGGEITFKLYGRFFNTFIGDGVPGHFQPVLEVVDENGKVLAYADDYFFDPDPVLTFTAPAEGKYTLRIRDALYRGREDFVYRVNVFAGLFKAPETEAPKIGKVPVRDMGTLKLTDPVKYPVILKHTLAKPCGNDYLVELKKDEEVVLEVFARRLGLPPDALLKVFDEDGKLLAYNDDTDRLKVGTILHNTADPVVYFKAPADGTYRINVSDTATAYGEAYKYFLRIDRKRERFALYTTPSTLRINANSANKLAVTVDRFDGFDGEIKLKIVSPQGYRFLGTDTIPAKSSQAIFTITGEQKKDRPIEELVIEGSAGKFKTRLIAGDEAMQAFAYTHINPAKTFPVRVMGRYNRIEFQKIKDNKVVLPVDKPVTLTAKLTNGYIPPNVEVKLEVENKPDWIKVVDTPVSKTKLVKFKVKERVRNKTKGKGNGKNKPQYRTVNRSRLEIPPMRIILQANKDAAGKAANVLIQASWVVTPKPDKKGRVRKYTQRVTLPAIQIYGGKN